MRGLPIYNGEERPKSYFSTAAIGSYFRGILRYCRRQEVEVEEDRTDQKKYIHVPTHAASSFLETATPRTMREANEVS